MIQSPDVEFIMEAHNGLSAKIVQEAGKYLTFFVNQEVITHLRYFLNILSSTLSVWLSFLGELRGSKKRKPSPLTLPRPLSLSPRRA